ncbi:hypothetical protein H9P43_004441 [Blastocladiella emersonii ATCC 22665]|nr:hypothetical protein H9P43_004441 [Blastocladiella emersonii ATCC 22665]
MSHHSKTNKAAAAEEPLDIHTGDHVSYHAINYEGAGTAHGVVEEILTHDKHLAGHKHGKVHASEDHPRVVIRNDRTHKTSAYNPESIIGKDDEGEPAPAQPAHKDPDHIVITKHAHAKQ